MSATSNLTAPSRNLLRFLRAQAANLDSVGWSWSRGTGGANTTSRRGPKKPLQRRSHCPPATPASRQIARARPDMPATTTILSGPGRPAGPRMMQAASLCTPPVAVLPHPRHALRALYNNSAGSWHGRQFSSSPPTWAAQPPPPPSPPQSNKKDIQMPLDTDNNEEDLNVFSSRLLAHKAAALDPRLRCTEVDENGEVVVVDGEFKKSELIAKYGLLPRDLRKIDSSNLPLILVRPSAILINLLHLKVLIKHDRLLLFDVYGTKTSYPQSAFMYDLQGKLQQKQSSANGGLPYEFRALEVVLMSVTTELEADYANVQKPVEKILGELEDDIDRDNLRRLLQLSKKVGAVEQKAKLVRDAIEELLEADDDLAAMYLTEKARGVVRGLEDHTEVEMLLESYHKFCVEVVQKASTLSSNIKNTEEIIRAILDANRNALMLLDLKFSVGTLGLATGTFLAGLYGMNLENFMETTNWGFGTVTAGAAIFSLMVCWYGLVKLRKVQRVKMGSSDDHSRDQIHRMLMDPQSIERLRRLKIDNPVKRRRWF